MFFKKNNLEEVMQKVDNELKGLNTQTCCFTGHRPQKLPWGFNENDKRCERMKANTGRLIEMAINSGYENFITGNESKFN